jgi:hypothetical protein
VSQAPTNFGPIAFTLTQPTAGKAVLRLEPAFTTAPKEIVVHLPWFVELHSATADGKVIQPSGGALLVAPGVKEIQLGWTIKANLPPLSYARTVADYKAEYARRYQFLMHGERVAKP